MKPDSISRPHIIMICADQHRVDTIGKYGSTVCQTPHLDRLASDGCLLEQCFAQNPVCLPSRATILTGRLSRNHRVIGNRAFLSKGISTLPEILKREGYQTAAVGKVHLTPQRDGPPRAPYYGFDELEAVEDHRIGPYLDWALKHFPDYEGYLLGTLFNLPAHEAYWRGKRDLRLEYLEARQRHVAPLEISSTCNWGFGHRSPLPEEAHHTTWITDRAVSRLNSHDPSRPLLLWVGYVAPHNPFDPPGRFREMYSWKDIPPPLGLHADEALLPVCTRECRRYFKSFTERDHRTLRALYYGSVTFLDHQIGRLLAAAERRLDMKSTIVVYLSDHGEHLGDHGIYGKTCYHYDAGVRVPCLLRGDGRWRAHSRSAGITELTDIFPTLLEFAGVPPPSGLDGHSFANRLRTSQGGSFRDHAFIESYGGGSQDPTPAPLTWAKTIRTPRWRATFFPSGSPGELYDLEKDPAELENLWFDPAFKSVLEEHRAALLDRLAAADHLLTAHEN